MNCSDKGDARSLGICLLGWTLLSGPGIALAVNCQVPGDRATLQAALDDMTCTEVELLNQTYPESLSIDRSIRVFGPLGGSAVVRGTVKVKGSGVLAMLADFAIEDGCPGTGLDAAGGAAVQAIGVPVQASSSFPCPMTGLIFSNGFE